MYNSKSHFACLPHKLTSRRDTEEKMIIGVFVAHASWHLSSRIRRYETRRNKKSLRHAWALSYLNKNINAVMQDLRGFNLFCIKNYAVITCINIVIINNLLKLTPHLSVHHVHNYEICNGLRLLHLRRKKFIHNLSVLSNTFQDHNEVKRIVK